MMIHTLFDMHQVREKINLYVSDFVVGFATSFSWNISQLAGIVSLIGAGLYTLMRIMIMIRQYKNESLEGKKKQQDIDLRSVQMETWVEINDQIKSKKTIEPSRMKQLEDITLKLKSDHNLNQEKEF